MTKKTVLTAIAELPELTSQLIQRPDHIVNPFAGQGRTPGHRFTLLRGEEQWAWAHVLRDVSGWTVISAGTLPLPIFPTDDEAGEYLIRQFLGSNGDGFDRLPRATYLQKGTTAHIRDEYAPCIAYCGATGDPAVFDTGEPGHAEQHCITCDRAYRAEHYGRTAVMY
ncbi:hypothetical protein AB0M39_35155 [Streptomyces sp. NPDC051907]|uniref:hypothetical protein n=1 Tax=Streptomyces sp. NPDC051907 TaxID=3155284 RepID=UPI00344AEA45